MFPMPVVRYDPVDRFRDPREARYFAIAPQQQPFPRHQGKSLEYGLGSFECRALEIHQLNRVLKACWRNLWEPVSRFLRRQVFYAISRYREPSPDPACAKITIAIVD
jgi:hypothetical protein